MQAGSGVPAAPRGERPSALCRNIGRTMVIEKTIMSVRTMTARPRAKLLVRRGRRSISGSAMRPWRRTKAAGAGQGDEQGDDGDGHGAGEDRRDAVEDADEGQRDERGGGRVQPRTGDLGLVADADEGGDPGRRDEHGEEGEEQVPVAEPEDRAGDDRAGGP